MSNMNNMNAESNYLTQYAQHLAEQNKANNTIKSYTKDIELFFKYFNLSPNIILRDQIKEYKDHLLTVKNNDAKSVNRSLSAIKSYNEFLVLKELQEDLVILSIDYMKIQKQLTSPTNTNIKEIIRFMNKIEKNENKRNFHIVSLLLNTGLRISELTNIKLTDIMLGNKKKLRIIGKGSKQRIIPINDVAVEIIKLAIENRNNYKYAENSLYLFVSNKGDKLNTFTIERIFNKYSDTITPHTCRHIFATNFLRNGGSLVALQQILGHSSLSTTQIYLHPSQDDVRKSMNNCSIR